MIKVYGVLGVALGVACNCLAGLRVWHSVLLTLCTGVVLESSGLVVLGFVAGVLFSGLTGQHSIDPPKS